MNTEPQAANPELVEAIASFIDDYYRDEITELAQRYPREQQSIVIDTAEIGRWDPDVRDDALAQPEQIRPFFADALRLVDLPTDVTLGDADVRFTTAIEPIGVSDLRIEHIDRLVRLSGQISKITPVRPQITNAAFDCKRCGTITRIPQSGAGMDEPHQCQGCERQGLFEINYAQSHLEHCQRARLTSPPEDTTTGDEHVDIRITGDDIVGGETAAGQRIDVIGVVELVPTGDKQLQTIHDYRIDAHALEPHDSDYEGIEVDDHLDLIEAAATDPDEIDPEEIEDEPEEIANLAESDPFELLPGSIAPSISGGEKMDDIKLALGLQAFSGWRRPHPDGRNVRGDSHICLIGDPGTGKSSLLDAIEEIVPRSAYTSGKNTTSAGLTAAVVPDDFGGSEWSMQAGVIVRANGGIACIDEIDKVHEEAKSSLHTALAKQIVPVNKAGISADLPAQTALLAAGNPQYGRFDRENPDTDQLNLEPAFASRFDLIFTLKDQPNPDRDERMAEHILRSRQISGQIARGDLDPDDERAALVTPAVAPETLRAWIAHARENYYPIIDREDVSDALIEYFVGIRESSIDAIPLTPRKLDAVQRLAEASARIRLSEEVTPDDIDRALRIVGRSLADVGINEDGEFDADMHELGRSAPQNERMKQITNALESATEPLTAEEILKRTTLSDQDGVEHDLQRLLDPGKVYQPEPGEYLLTEN